MRCLCLTRSSSALTSVVTVDKRALNAGREEKDAPRGLVSASLTDDHLPHRDLDGEPEPADPGELEVSSCESLRIWAYMRATSHPPLSSCTGSNRQVL